MATTHAARSESVPDRSGLTRAYLLVLAVEVVVLAGLFWLGRHFG
jgi:hypothetical protein